MKKCPNCGAVFDYTNDGKCSRWPICQTLDTSSQNISLQDYIVFDLETTGFNRSTERIIEIGAVMVKDNQVIDTFKSLCHPGKFISARITEVTGITNEMLANKDDEIAVVQKFMKWIQKSDIHLAIAHNGKSFDIPFLQNACKRAKVKCEFTHILDTMLLARNLKLQERGVVENNKQPTLAAHYGISYNAHRAVDDAKALYDIFQFMSREAGEDLQRQVENV